MQKQLYLKPATDVLEMSAECSVLTMSTIVEANTLYEMSYDGVDDEFI